MRIQLCIWLTLCAVALLGTGLVACGSIRTATRVLMPLPEATDTVSGASSPSAPSTFIALATPSANPTTLPSGIYPPPVSVAPGIGIGDMTAGCPNPDGLEQASELPASAVEEVFRGLASGDLDIIRRVTDRAFWPYAASMGVGTPRPFSKDMLEKPRPAGESPYAGLVANACGGRTLELSWWVQGCPGPCADPDVARAADLMGQFYLIRRRGHWLVWAAR